MKPILNKAMLRQTTIDSGSLAIMNSIIHKLTEQGAYRGLVYRGAAQVGTFSLQCDFRETPAEETLPSETPTIDLCAFECSAGAQGKCSCSGEVSFSTDGHVMFTVLQGTGEYAVELFRKEEKKDPVKVFDSRLLGGGDIYITHVLRPGSYEIRNTGGSGSAALTVEYPEQGTSPRNMEPVLIESKDGAINPNKIKIKSVQAIMFHCVQDSRISIELKEAEDRPRPAPAPLAALRMLKKEKPAAGQKKILRKIQFFG